MPVTQRHFGVELEHGNDQGYGHAAVLQKMGDAKFSVGIDRYGRGRPTCYTSTYDGSGVEIRTPALKGLAGLAELERVMLFLKEIGGFTGRADGMHVHHEAKEYYANWTLIQDLANTWTDNLSFIRQFVDPRRTGKEAYNRHITKAGIKRACDARRLGRAYFPRGDLNFGALNEHGTIEIRIHEGTLDPAKAKSWVVFGQSLVSHVARYGAFEKQDTYEGLLDKLEITEKYRVPLRRAVSND